MAVIVAQLSAPYGLNLLDMFFLEALIADRLALDLTGVAIDTLLGKPRIDEEDTVVPTVMLFLEDQTIPDKAGRGKALKIEQTWTLLCIVDTSIDNAGVLVSRVMNSLSGWSPDLGSVGAFVPVTSGYKHEYSQNNVFYYPVGFKTHFVFSLEE